MKLLPWILLLPLVALAALWPWLPALSPVEPEAQQVTESSDLPRIAVQSAGTTLIAEQAARLWGLENTDPLPNPAADSAAGQWRVEALPGGWAVSSDQTAQRYLFFGILGEAGRRRAIFYREPSEKKEEKSKSGKKSSKGSSKEKKNEEPEAIAPLQGPPPPVASPWLLPAAGENLADLLVREVGPAEVILEESGGQTHRLGMFHNKAGEKKKDAGSSSDSKRKKKTS